MSPRPRPGSWSQAADFSGLWDVAAVACSPQPALFSHPSGPLTPQGLHRACAGLGVHVRGCSLSWEDVPRLSSGRVGWAAGQGSCSPRAKGASSNTRCCEKSSCLGSALPSLFSKPSSAFSLTSFICLLFCIPSFYFSGFLLAHQLICIPPVFCRVHFRLSVSALAATCAFGNFTVIQG